MNSLKNQDRLAAELKEAGLKNTPARRAVLKILSGGKCPLSAHEIHKALIKEQVDPVTVYRTLEALESGGLAQRVDFGDGVARYEISHKDHHHHHVICRACKRIDRLPDCTFHDLERAVKRMGYRNLTHSLEFFGVCKSCASK